MNVNTGTNVTTVTVKGKVTKNPFMEHKQQLAKKQKVRTSVVIPRMDGHLVIDDFEYWRYRQRLISPSVDRHVLQSC